MEMQERRKQIMLAALAAGGPNAVYTPVQVQKLFFILDQELHGEMGGPLFSFRPYDFGPFDKEVYTELRNLKADTHTRIDETGRYYRYSLSKSGFEIGQKILNSLSETERRYMKDVAEWILPLSFTEVVSAVYKKYPEMKVNSIFR